MQNLPRLYLDGELTDEQLRYLTRVMRKKDGDKFIVFYNGAEFTATLRDGRAADLTPTNRPDPANDITLAFAPIKQSRAEEMINACTQLGVRAFQPVITARTNEHHLNYKRLQKIAVEAAEQSGRNSVPTILAEKSMPVLLAELESKRVRELIFADERFAHTKTEKSPTLSISNSPTLLIGPEGGFSDAEFAALDTSGAVGISLGKTILRAEVAAIAAISLIPLPGRGIKEHNLMLRRNFSSSASLCGNPSDKPSAIKPPSRR